MASETDHLQRERPSNGHNVETDAKEFVSGGPVKDVGPDAGAGLEEQTRETHTTDTSRGSGESDNDNHNHSDTADNVGNTPVVAAALSERHNGNGTVDDVPHLEPLRSATNSASHSAETVTQDEEGEPSSQVTSPSVSSPPYWIHAHHIGLLGHGRNISNMSVESVLPPGAITLQDNEREDAAPSANSAYGRDRNRACWAKSVQITDYVVVNGSATNFGAFVVWNIRVRTLSGSNINIRKRYSEFDDFRKQLVQTFPNFEAAVPELPPKSVISKFRPNFLEKRRVGLQYFLNCILLNPEFSGSPVLKEFLFS